MPWDPDEMTFPITVIKLLITKGRVVVVLYIVISACEVISQIYEMLSSRGGISAE